MEETVSLFSGTAVVLIFQNVLRGVLLLLLKCRRKFWTTLNNVSPYNIMDYSHKHSFSKLERNVQTFKRPLLVLQLLLPFFPQDSSTVTMNEQRTCEPISPKFRKPTCFICSLGICSSESQGKFLKHQDGLQTSIKRIKSTFTFYFNTYLLMKKPIRCLETISKTKMLGT